MERSTWLERVVSVAILLTIWQVIAMIINQPLLIASPVDVIQRLGTIWMEDGFWSSIAYSFSRIVAGFFISFFLGVALAVAAGRFHAVEALLLPLMLTIKTVPIVAIILICLIFMTSSQLTALIVVLLVLPIIYNNVLEGIKSTDKNLLQMVKVFRVPYTKRLLYVYLPQIKPFLVSACSVSLGSAWKAGIAAEVLSVPAGSIGGMMHDAKVYFHTTDLLAWTIIVVLLSLLFEKVFLLLMKRLFTWMESL